MRKVATSPKTVAEFLTSLEAKEMTVAQWAREKGLPARTVYSLIKGRYTGRTGQAREVLKAMGLPTPPIHSKLALNGATAS